MASFSLKVKTTKGQYIIKDLTESTTIQDLKAKIQALSNIPLEAVHILLGFPPKPVDLKNDDTLTLVGIKNGETIIVEEKVTIEPPKKETSPPVKLPQSEGLNLDDRAIDDLCMSEGILLKQVVPSDNSCLFTSIGFVMNGKIETDRAADMREIIASHVAADKETYNEAILGKPNPDYCDWIRKSDSWGGAIEVSILSAYYGIEIDVVDVTNAIINRFGEDKEYGIRAFLLFDGIHYDPLYLEPFNGGNPKTLFPLEDAAIFQQAEQLAQEAKSSRQFTDVNHFTLKCLICDCLLKGQVEAQQHAKTTGHTNFGEV